MYSWVVDFLNYFISISERDVGTEVRSGGGGIVKKFFCKYLYIVFIIIIKCKVSFSSHSISFFVFFFCK